MVEYASTRLRSFCTVAMSAATRAVVAPTIDTIVSAPGQPMNSGAERVIK